MVQETPFRGVITFLDKLGIYDVILPFLLVFTIVFAILEKTKILGMEKVGEEKITKKNLNSMVALAIAFLVVASTKLVSVINEVMANIVLLLILAVSFLLLVGVFFADKEFSMEDYPPWIKFFMFFMFIGIVVIFLEALDWLQEIIDFLEKWPSEWTTTTVFVVIIAIFIVYIVSDPKKKEKKKEEKED